MSTLTVDVTAPTPVYEQIRSQVTALVAVGTLTPGDRLPASRDLARDLGIAVGTVQRAYRELEAAGVVVSRRRAGTTIAATAAAGGQSAASPPPDTTALIAQARALVAAARDQGLDDDSVVDLVRGALASP